REQKERAGDEKPESVIEGQREEQSKLRPSEALITQINPFHRRHPMLAGIEWMPEALPLIKPQQPHRPERAKRVTQTVARDIEGAARIVSRDAPALNEAVNKQTEQENHAAVIEQERRAAGQPSHEEPRP